jgi:diacylglycerol kinase (ATP)
VHLALVINPKSGAGRSENEVGEALTARGHEVSSFALDRAGAAAASGADRVVVAGGDGSVGPVFAACAEHRVPLAVLPSGTANDFARAMEIPPDFQEAVALATDPDAAHRPVWGATLDGHPFVNVASIGLGVNAAEEAAPFKSQLGPVAYALGAAIAATRGRHVKTRVTVDGETVFSGDVWQVLVAASGAFGGVVQLPVSDPETPEIEVYVVHAGSRVGLLRRAWGMRRGGARGGVSTFQGTCATVDLDPELRWNVDGELLDLGDVEARPLGPVRVCIPASASEGRGR